MLCMGGCRAVLGIDDARPALGHGVPDASAEDGDDAGRQGYCSTLSPAEAKVAIDDVAIYWGALE
jgi:hypothetical protein